MNITHLFDLTYAGESYIRLATATHAPEISTYTADGLTVTVRKRAYAPDALYWDVTLRNPSAHNSKRVKDIHTVDITLPFTPATLHTTRGAWQADIETDFVKDVRPLTESISFSSAGGRSSQGTMPYFRIDNANATEGLLCAIGWSGQWKATVTPLDAAVQVTAGIENADLYLYPGEELYLGSGIALHYTDSPRAAHNRFRAILRDLSPLGKDDRPTRLPVSLTFWGSITDEELRSVARTFRANDVPVELVWIDSGWFHPQGIPINDWVAYNGEWELDSAINPDHSYGEAASVVHENGYDFLLWYEPERSSENAAFAVRHPEAFLHLPTNEEVVYNVFGGMVSEDCKWRLQSCLVNLGCEMGYNFMWNTLTDGIERHGLDWLRIDFNVYPLGYWERNDIQSRTGITQIKYINGLYRLLDALLKKYPHLMIDNCASGGSRLDLEMQKYSIALWRSDCQCEADRAPEVLQSQAMGTADWFLSYAGAGSRNAFEDKYRLRSSYSGGTNVFFSFTQDGSLDVYNAIFADPENNLRLFKTLMQEFDTVRDCYNGDYYPLSTQTPHDLTVWCAWQYEKDSVGVLQAFRRREAPDATYTLPLHVEPGKTYRFYSFDTKETFKMTSEELADGLTVTLDEPYSSLVIRYEIL